MKTARFASIDALPPHLRDQARKQLDGVRRPLAAEEERAKIEQLCDATQWTAEEIELLRKQGPGRVVGNPVHNPGVIHRPSKYGATAIVVDGIRFDSKREARHYEGLKARMAAGEVRYFLRQVPLHLPGGTKLVIDFLEIHADGSLHFVDAKGFETPAFKIKRREVEHHYPIKLELV